MSHVTKAELQSIIAAPDLNRQQKIDLLLDMQIEARAIQRAASESNMDPDDGLSSDLRKIELALEELGTESDDTGAATL